MSEPAALQRSRGSAGADDSGRVAWMLLGLLAIPVGSVTAVTLFADVASTTDPAAAAIGVPAVVAGLVTAWLIARLASGVCSGAVALRATLVRSSENLIGLVCELASQSLPRQAVRPVVAFVPASIGRRGPPLSLR